jgi:peptidoglycan/LPS O-acetylase OafA/YrhL
MTYCETTSKSSVGRSGHIRCLDALRGWAILGVISVHVQAAVGSFPGKRVFATGHYGVQLFFLLSSLTLCLSSYDRWRLENYPAARFMIRRAFRILPLWWFAILFDNFATLPPHTYHLAGQLIATGFFLNVWNPLPAQGVVLGGWSIAVEVFAYLLLPVVFVALRKRPIGRAVWLMATALLLTKIGSFGQFLQHRVGVSCPDVFVGATGAFSLPFNAPAFATGILLFTMLKDTRVGPFCRRLSHWLITPSALACLVILGFVKLRFIPTVVVYSAVFAIIIIRVWHKEEPLLVNRFTTYLGKISYSCYVVHFIVLQWIIATAKTIGFHFFSESTAKNGIDFIVLFSATLLSTIVLSQVSYSFIETPGIAFGQRLLKVLPAADISRFRCP